MPVAPQPLRERPSREFALSLLTSFRSAAAAPVNLQGTSTRGVAMPKDHAPDRANVRQLRARRLALEINQQERILERLRRELAVLEEVEGVI